MYCPNCGIVVGSSDRYCRRCGQDLTASSAPIEWETRDFVYVWTSGVDWVMLGPWGYTEVGARYHFWQRWQSRIAQALQQWRDDGWQPIGEVGPECVRLRYYEKYNYDPIATAIIGVLVVATLGLILLIVPKTPFAEPTEFRLPMRRPKRAATAAVTAAETTPAWATGTPSTSRPRLPLPPVASRSQVPGRSSALDPLSVGHEPSPLKAALLSTLLLGGAGQMYLGQKKKGAALMSVALATHLLLGSNPLASLVLFHNAVFNVLGAVDAYTIGKRKQRGQAVREWEIGSSWRGVVVSALMFLGLGFVLSIALGIAVSLFPGLSCMLEPDRAHCTGTLPSSDAVTTTGYPPPASQETVRAAQATATDGRSPATVPLDQHDEHDEAMQPIPAGGFLMGAEGDPAAKDREKPQHLVRLDDYAVDRTEVTIAMFAEFIASSGHLPAAARNGYGYRWLGGRWAQTQGAHWEDAAGDGSPDNGSMPVTQVSWDDAHAYCAWAHRRLPTEAEWEKAARGSDGRRFPWGDAEPTDALLRFGQLDGPVAVGSFPAGASPFGVMDMAGNVWEWTADWYGPEYYAESPADNPAGPASGQYRVIRGGGWNTGPSNARVTNRDVAEPDSYNDMLGFRCAD